MREISNRGWIHVFPEGRALHDNVFEPKIKIVSMEGCYIIFSNIKIPIKPMLGTAGVTPVDSEIPTVMCGFHGGNVDLR